MAVTDEEWLPLGVEGDEVAQFTAQWTDIPDWFQPSLWSWIDPNLVGRGMNGAPALRADLVRQASRVLRVSLPELDSCHVESGPDALRRQYAKLGSKALLAFVDFLMSGLPEGHSYLQELEANLVESGSGWRVGSRAGKPGLVQRLPVGVTDAASKTVQRGDAGKRLAQAWESVFGVSPDPTKAYSLAVKAVEDTAIPVVCPNDTGATLGRVIGQVNAGTWKLVHLREDVNAPTHDVLVGMMKTLWVGQHDRHGGPSAVGIPAVTQAEAESAVMLAVTLVGWFETGKVQQ